jgi:hypothetical protein
MKDSILSNIQVYQAESNTECQVLNYLSNEELVYYVPLVKVTVDCLSK